MIIEQPDQKNRFHGGLLWKNSWYPIQKCIFAVKKGKPKKVQVTERLISLWGQECYQSAYNTSM